MPGYPVVCDQAPNLQAVSAEVPPKLRLMSAVADVALAIAVMIAQPHVEPCSIRTERPMSVAANTALLAVSVIPRPEVADGCNVVGVAFIFKYGPSVKAACTSDQDVCP